MPQQQPLVSIILPVYNTAAFVEESVRSVLDQTYKNFELIIINDGSKDNSEEVIKKIHDDRIRYYYQTNCGMAGTLNRGIDLAQGDFIARQDGDDTSLPERLQKQVDFLIKYPKVGLVGTWAEIIPIKNNVRRFHKHAADNTQIKIDLLINNPFVHSSVMMRKDVLKAVGHYDINKETLVQDFDLWTRFSRISEVANLPEVLVYYRELSSGLSQTTPDYSKKVITQSIENISYFHPGDTIIVNQLARLLQGDYGALDEKISLAQMLIILNDLVNKIAENTGEEISRVRAKMAFHVRTLKFRYYKGKQLLAEKNILLKLWYILRYRISTM